VNEQNKENISSSNSELMLRSKLVRSENSEKLNNKELKESKELNVAIISNMQKKEDDSTSSLSISAEFPKAKKKILLSMEVITEEKPKDTGESFVSEKKNIKMFQETTIEDGTTCPVPSATDLDQYSDKNIFQKQNEKEGIMMNNKIKKNHQKKQKKKENDNPPKPQKEKNQKNSKSKELEIQKKKGQPSKKNIKDKDSDHVLSFSSGTNLTQTTFDFGFSKLGACECSLVDKFDSNKTDFIKAKIKKNQKQNKSKNEKNIQAKVSKKKYSKSKIRSKKKKCSNFQKEKKCCQCGKSSDTSSRNSVLEVPNFIVQPFNKYDIVLEPRNYDQDQRGTLGKYDDEVF
jgi:hypothetical protein